MHVRGIDMLDETMNECHILKNGRPAWIRARYRVERPDEMAEELAGRKLLDCLVFIQARRGHGALTISTQDLGQSVRIHPDGGELLLSIERLDLAPGTYGMTVIFYTGPRSERDIKGVYDAHSRLYTFQVVGRPNAGPLAALEAPCEWSVI